MIDTSCWVDQLLYPGGAADKAIQQAQKSYTIVHSWDTLTELAEVLSQKRHDRLVSPEERAEYLTIVMEISDVHANTHKIESAEDFADNEFIGLAMSCGAHDLLSKDKDLRVLKHVQGVQIWSPEQFYDREIDNERMQMDHRSPQMNTPPTFDPKHAREELAPTQSRTMTVETKFSTPQAQPSRDVIPKRTRGRRR